MQLYRRKWFWPGVATVLLATFLAYFSNKDKIEADLTERAQTALSEHGHDSIKVQVNARHAFIDKTQSYAAGEEPSDNGSDILGLVKGIYGIREVTGRISVADAVTPFTWSASANSGKIVLDGYVPDEAARQELLALAGGNVVDNLQIGSGYPNRDQWLESAKYTLNALKGFQRGQADLSDLNLSISGMASDLDNYNSLTQNFGQALPSGLELAATEINPPLAEPFSWVATREGDEIRLEGYVASEELRQKLIAKAQEIAGDNVIDEMSLAYGGGEDFETVALATISGLEKVKSAKVTFNGQSYFMKGAAENAEEQDIAKTYFAGVAGHLASTISLDVIGQEQEPEQEPESVVEKISWVLSQESGKVDLTGVVPNEASRKLANDLLAPHGLDIKNALTVSEQKIGFSDNIMRQILPYMAQFSDASIKFDGQKLMVSGTTASAETRDKILADLKSDAVGNTEVVADIKLVSSTFVWTVERGPKNIKLSGTMPNEAAVTQVEELVAGWGLPITNELTVQDQDPGNNAKVLQAAMTGLEALTQGAASYDGQKLSVTGQVGNEDEKNQANELMRSKLSDDIALDAKIQVIAAKSESALSQGCSALQNYISSKQPIQFGINLARLQRNAYGTIDTLASHLRSCPEATVKIEGHTDNDGPEDYNIELSLSRAEQVMNYLINSDVAKGRLSAVGFGSTIPVAPNTSRENKARNRRIEFQLSLEN